MWRARILQEDKWINIVGVSFLPLKFVVETKKAPRSETLVVINNFDQLVGIRKEVTDSLFDLLFQPTAMP